jgi:hypothetical protein
VSGEMGWWDDPEPWDGLEALECFKTWDGLDLYYAWECLEALECLETILCKQCPN